MKKIIQIAILLLVIGVKHNGFASNFYYTTIIDSVPYVIINDVNIIHKTQNFLMHSYFVDKRFQGQKVIELDTINTELLTKISLYWDVYEYKLFPINGTDNYLKYVVGFKPNDKLRIQYVTNNCSAKYREITVDKIYFNVFGDGSTILLKCKPIKIDSEWFEKSSHKFGCPFITYSYLAYKRNAPTGAIDTVIPSNVKNKVDSLENIFIPNDINDAIKNITIQKLRYFDNENNTTNYFYAAIISYGEKGVTGSLYLFDSFANIIQEIDNESYNQILGITDVNIDGTNELIVFKGSFYGGGISILNLELNKKEKKINIVNVRHLWTVFD